MEKRLKETLLSRKPERISAYPALLSLLACMVFSVISWESVEPFNQWIKASRQSVLVENENWRLFTTIFVHGDLRHLLSNAWGLGILSFALYGYFGFWVYPIWALLLSALTNALALASYPNHTVLIGASGLVYLMFGFWLAIYIAVDRRFSFLKRMVRALGFALVILFPTTFEENVSYRTHAIGFFLGCIWGITYFFLFAKARIRKKELWVVDEPEPRKE